MTFVISAACIDVMDQSCIEVCPVDCIFFEDDDQICYIQPEQCIDCAVCESACPVGAIFEADRVPNALAEFTVINQLWFEDKADARSKVAAFALRSGSIV